MAEPQHEAMTKHTLGRIATGLVMLFGVPLGLYVGQATLETRFDVRDTKSDIRHIQEIIDNLKQEQAELAAQLRMLELQVATMGSYKERGNK